MNILVPITITEAMIASGTTVAEPAAGETLWVSGGTFTLAELCIRSTTHRVYRALQAHSGRTALPEVDTLFWQDIGPTKRHAPFDKYTTTSATGTTSITYVLRPGFFDAISLYGLTGSAIEITAKDEPGGTVHMHYSGGLYAPATGIYELMFTPLQPIEKLVFFGIPISPTAELTITVTAATGDPVGIGMINVGDLRHIIGDAEWGGVEHGVEALPKSYSYIKTYDDGSVEIKRRGKSTDLRGSVSMPAASATYAMATIQSVLDVPVSIICTTKDGYAWLNVFGLISGSLKDGSGLVTFSFDAKGFL